MANGQNQRVCFAAGGIGESRPSRSRRALHKLKEKLNLKEKIVSPFLKKILCDFKGKNKTEKLCRKDKDNGEPNSFEVVTQGNNESTAGYDIQSDSLSSLQQYVEGPPHTKGRFHDIDIDCMTGYKQTKNIMGNQKHRMDPSCRCTDHPEGGNVSFLELPPNAMERGMACSPAKAQKKAHCYQKGRNRKHADHQDNGEHGNPPLVSSSSVEVNVEHTTLRSAKSMDGNPKPEYNSLCTKCMPDEDKITKGFKGLLIQTPIFNYITDDKMPASRDATPTFDRSILIQEKALVNGMSISDVYDLHSHRLGKGSYGQVLKARHKETGEINAVKIIRKANIENAMRMKREISIMKALDHPNIVRLLEVYEDEECLYLVMEMCSGGELFDEIVRRGCFSEQYAATMMRQIFSAVAYCHGRDIIHRDLKPENIIYANMKDESPIKIIDWGFATKCGKSHKFHTLVGTPYYVAPEVLIGNYDKSCDMWSAGVILFIMLVGYPPFHGNDNATILKNVKRGTINFVPHHWRNISKKAIELITRCLSYDPRYRITAKEAFNHEWILQNVSNIYIHPSVRHSLTKDLVKRFKQFDQYSTMKRLALTCIAHHLSDVEIAPLNTAFEMLNIKGDGVIYLKDIAKDLKTGKCGEGASIENVVSNLKGNEAIDYVEFIAASMEEDVYMQKDFCMKAFRLFDRDGAGVITRENMKRVLQCDMHMGDFPDEFVDEIFNEVDMDRDGVISYTDFCTMLYGLSRPVDSITLD